MSEGQINIRLDPNLKREFDVEVKKRGLNTTKLMTSWIKNFVRGEENLTICKNEAFDNLQTERKKLEEQISCLNQKMKQLEETIVILSVIQHQFLAPLLRTTDDIEEKT